MPIYGAVQHEVKMTAGFVPKTCWIAHVLEFQGSKLRTAPNRIGAKTRKHPCPLEKQDAIVDALRKLGGRDLRPCRGSL
jgi:hypothetical protein